jgi:ribonuclease HI
LLEALDLAERRGADEVDIQADSELVVRQILGAYRVRHPDLKPLHDEALRRIGRFRVFRIRHVRRAGNRDADRLVNLALDRLGTAEDPGAVRLREDFA